MRRLSPDKLIKNRFKIVSPVHVDSNYIVYRAVDVRFPGKLWLLHQVEPLLTDQAELSSRLSRVFEFLTSASKLTTDRIGKVVDFFLWENYVVIVTEYVEGVTLQEVIYSTSHFPEPNKIINLGLQLTDIVSMLYSKGLVYGVDLNPQTVMIYRNSVVKISHFAFDKLVNAFSDDIPIGTLGYIPPEFLDEDPRTIGPWSYVYVIAAIMYEFATRMPLVEHVSRGSPFEFPPLKSVNPYLPEELCLIFEKALAFSPANRYSTFKAFRADLANALKKISPSTAQYALPSAVFIKKNINPLTVIILALVAVQIVVVMLIIYYLVLW